METHFHRSEKLWLAILGIAAFLVTYSSRVSYTESDARGSLLTSQAILEHGTIKLDSYGEAIEALRGYRILQKNGHVYYFFPIGTSLYSLPFVWLANLCGMDMSDMADDDALQNALSAITTSLSFIFVYMICRCYLYYYYSFLVSSAFLFGSSLISTMGTALWSTNLTVVFNLLSLLIIVYDQRQKNEINPYLLGLFLFSAYLCRPTASIFVIVVLFYILAMRRNFFIRLLIVFMLLLALFVLFSLKEYGQILPDYYLPSRLSTNTFWLALYGNLLSPARGILVLSPFLILVLVGLIYYFRQLRREALLWVAIGWFVLHLIAISKYPHWWGGCSFGSRLLTDAIPALILCTILVWDRASNLLPSSMRRAAISLFILLSIVGILINTYQGLYNTYIHAWNAFPLIDTNPNYLFDWKYPQFLANPHLLAKRSREYVLRHLQPYTIGQEIAPDDPQVFFDSWYDPEGTPHGDSFRWSQGKSARIMFEIESLDIGIGETLFLEVDVGSYQTQTVDVLVNGSRVGSTVVQDPSPSTYTFPVDISILKFNQPGADEYNTVEFLIPGAVIPARVSDSPDTRIIGISLWRFKLSRTQNADLE